MEKLNTHFYDGKLSITYPKNKQEYSEQDYTRILNEMEKYINQGYKGKYNKNTILKSIKLLYNPQKTYDKTDNLDARQLISCIWTKINQKEMWNGDYDYIYEQIHDITASGPCPQGVVKRIYQIYNCLIQE